MGAIFINLNILYHKNWNRIQGTLGVLEGTFFTSAEFHY